MNNNNNKKQKSSPETQVRIFKLFPRFDSSFRPSPCSHPPFMLKPSWLKLLLRHQDGLKSERQVPQHQLRECNHTPRAPSTDISLALAKFFHTFFIAPFTHSEAEDRHASSHPFYRRKKWDWLSHSSNWTKPELKHDALTPRPGRQIPMTPCHPRTNATWKYDLKIQSYNSHSPSNDLLHGYRNTSPRS